jgi:hypothetical protein
VSVDLRYDLTGSGWSECTVRIDDVAATVTASYLSDALDELCRAVADVLRGDATARASFDEEPGEYRWIFDRAGADRLRVRILMFNEYDGGRPDNEGTSVFDAECRLRTFAGALLSELQRLLSEYGEDGYRGRWIEHEFPTRRIAQLRGLLDGGGG